MAGYKENEDFTKSILSFAPLDDAIEWVRTNMNPEEVFDKRELIEWAKTNMTPEEVFDKKQLQEWANNDNQDLNPEFDFFK